MALSQKKRDKMEMADRRKKVAERSLDGKGYFMDANVEADIARYLRSGDEHFLNQLPDYRKIRGTK